MAKFRTRELAAYGYVVLAMDSYGKNNQPSNSTQAGAQITALRNNPSM
jgi:dienelactone hydrolase